MTSLQAFASLGGVVFRRSAILKTCKARKSQWTLCRTEFTTVVSPSSSTTNIETSSNTQKCNLNIIDVLQERGLFDSGTGDIELLREHCSEPRMVYAGFDPTADSLHLGNLLALISLRWFQLCGHRAVALLGGATGRVGDPSGKSVERPLMTEKELNKNIHGIETNIRTILGDDALIVNNHDWVGPMSFLEFLRDVGRHARVPTMLAKDSVRSRLESTEGLSFTEFSYQLLQAYDFMYLSDEHDVSIQLGGSDQWGNITAGTELTRKLRQRTVHGVTFPLLTTSDGKKFGKSEHGALWLNGEKLSPYSFYQHLFATEDVDVGKFLRRLTFLPLQEIERVESQNKQQPNYAQKILAEEVTRIVHGDGGVRSAIAATEAAKPGGTAKLDMSTLEAIANDMPSVELQRNDVVDNMVVDVMVKAGLQKSKGEARRLVKNGGAYVNNVKVMNEKNTVGADDLVGDCMLLLAAGKKNKMLVRVQ